jgi:hypothetical protein
MWCIVSINVSWKPIIFFCWQTSPSVQLRSNCLAHRSSATCLSFYLLWVRFIMVKQTSCTTHGHQQWQSVLSASAFFPCCPVQLWRYTLTYVGYCCAIFEANGDFVLACEILTLLRTALETKRTVSQVNDWGLLMKVVGFGWGIVFVVFVVSFFCFRGKNSLRFMKQLAP